jgi:hypothetical protein
MLPILKLLTPTVLNGIVKYVFEKNPLDHQMEIVLERLEKLEENSHPIRDFVVCDKCKQEIKEK